MYKLQRQYARETKGATLQVSGDLHMHIIDLRLATLPETFLTGGLGAADDLHTCRDLSSADTGFLVLGAKSRLTWRARIIQ